MGDKGRREGGLGNMASFFHDGVFGYKKKLGMGFIGAFDAWLPLRVARNTNATLAFLQANPVKFERNSDLYGVVFPDAQGPSPDGKRLRQLHRDFNVEGTARRLIARLCSANRLLIAPGTLSGPTGMYAASKLFG